MPTPARLRVPQLELFRPAPNVPATLPPEVYAKTVPLLARLLCEYAQTVTPNRPEREVGHE